jgi:hypothetical protein
MNQQRLRPPKKNAHLLFEVDRAWICGASSRTALTLEFVTKI